ncbi:GatB/YqeY domain-containing protein [Corynebacterium uropygiale]|uniref:GatB/YqeY domain-containing protein n=1 Tax=Corynebacterium uropygiale TaxID=1775911 RepID=A0A9X1U6J2_9CORY|nr:GatB/YqeY domain-containing protein [Corynebacterium uropygiale]MCF4005737.1 GatB/YqeY domain-containing protein [Corynebacterium uropygiale]
MSELKNRIRQDLSAAMKARDDVRKGALRMLVSAITYEERSGSQHELSDEEILGIVAREIKKRRESADIYAQNDRPDLAEREEAEAAVLAEYQPSQFSDEELSAFVAEVVQEVAGENPTMKNMGPVMKAAQARAAGRVDGKRLSTAVRAALS